MSHKTEADLLLDYLHYWQECEGDVEATGLLLVLESQTKATLALVEAQEAANEQARIANRIEITRYAVEQYGNYAPEGARISSLFLPPETTEGNVRLAPEIARALGIGGAE